MEELLGTEENNTVNSERGKERLQKAQNNRRIARLTGTLMVGLIACHWYNTLPYALSRTALVSVMTNIAMPLLDLSAIVGFVISWKNERRGGRLMFMALAMRAMWVFVGVHDPLTITSAVILGFIASITFLVSNYQRSDQPEEVLRTMSADELRFLAQCLYAVAIIRYVWHWVLYYGIMDVRQPFAYFYITLFILGCFVAGRIALKKQFAGAIMMVFFALLFTAFVHGVPYLLLIAITFVVSGVLHIVSSFLYDPKPEPLPEVED